MAKVAASLPGFASVARAGEVLHLAPRSVRGLIYAGRLPSVRLGRLHYIRVADLELERRRRLGLAAPHPRAPRARPRRRPSAAPRSRVPAAEAPSASVTEFPPAPTLDPDSAVALPVLFSDAGAQSAGDIAARSRRAHARADAELRRQRAAERAELVKHWAQRHPGFTPQVPATVLEIEDAPVTCAACNRQVRRGRYVELSFDRSRPVETLCTACARRALLEWADRRRQEAAAARELSQSLGQPAPAPVVQPHLLVA